MSWARTWIPTGDLSSVDGGRHICRPYITPPYSAACRQLRIERACIPCAKAVLPPRRLNAPCCVFASSLAQRHAAGDRR